MRKRIFGFIVISLLLFAMLASCSQARNIDEEPKAKEPEQPYANEIKVSFPKPNDVIKSPVVVTGEAIGNWYFEAVFGVRLVDDQGKELARTYVEAQSNWMTPDFVPFKREIPFSPGTAKKGKLIFENDNPSGEPERSKSFEVPVRFE